MSMKCFINVDEINDAVIPLPSLVLRLCGGSVRPGEHLKFTITTPCGPPAEPSQDSADYRGWGWRLGPVD